LQLERLSLELVRLAPPLDRALGLAAGPDHEDETTVELYEAHGWQAVPLWHRQRLRGGEVLVGPALIIEATGTIFLARGWSAQVLAAGELLLQRDGSLPPNSAANPASAEMQPKNVAVAATNDHANEKMHSPWLLARSTTLLRGMLRKNASAWMRDNAVNSCKMLYNIINSGKYGK
jgi:hypothetical protein